MIRRHGLRLLLLIALATTPLAGQSAPLALAHSLVDAAAAATDDPDATAAALLAAAAEHGDSTIAVLPCIAAMALLDRLQRPSELLAVVERTDTAPMHGVLAQRWREFAFRLHAAVGSDGSGRDVPPAVVATDDPYRQFAREFVVVGPFGDSGDHYVGVTFAPELRFPPPDLDLAGRFGPVRTRPVQRLPYERRVALLPASLSRSGCCYALHRVDVDTATPGFVELECDGAAQLFLNGVEIGRLEPYREPGPVVRRFPAQWPVGQNQVLVKTCTTDNDQIALRYVDGRGRALPGLREVAASAPLIAPPAAAAADGGAFADSLTALAQAANHATGDDRAVLQLALLLQSSRAGATDTALAMADALLAAPPAEPVGKLAFAGALRALEPWPEELRRQQARGLEDAAAAALPPAHHRALMARVRQLEDEDKGEAALRLLRAAIVGKQAGPETFAATFALLQRLHFDAEVEPLLQQWSQALPADVRPREQLAQRLIGAGAPEAALLQLCAALRARPDAASAQNRAFALAVDLGDAATARRCLDLGGPVPTSGPAQLRRLLALATLARRTGDAAQQRAALTAIGEHPDADAAVFERLGDHWLQLGDTAAAASAWQHTLLLQPDRHELRAELARLLHEPLPGSELLPFRRDGDQAIAAFQKTPREDGASTTVLIDQMLVEVLADGSRLEEVHQLRRINDLQGVEAMKTPPEPAHADELLLLRTVVDGHSYVPSRTGGTFAMPRLCPGAFVEWRYRNRVRSPGAEPWRAPQFLFGDANEPDLLAEFVLVLPAGGRGELRRRGGVPTPSEQTLADGQKALVFRRTDVPRLPEEHDAPPAAELLPLLQYGEDSQLAAYARQVRASLLQQTRPTPIVQQKAAAIVDALQGDARIAAIHRYTMAEIAEGPDEGPTAAVLRGKGERFLVELALLRAAGCQVDFAVVAPAREDLLNRGRPLFLGDDALPLPAARIAGERAPIWLFADAPRYLPLGLVPAARAGAAALVANEHGDELVTLPTTAGDIAQRFAVSGSAVLAASGEVAASGSIAFTDVIAFNLAEQLRDLKADVRKLAARQLAQRFFPDWRPVSASLLNLEPPGQTPAVAFTFARRQLQRDGDRCLLPLPLPQGRFLAAFGDRPGRELPLHLTQEMAADWSILFDPGDSFTVTALPAPVLLQRGPLTYSLRCVPEGGKVRIERHAVLRAASIPPTELAEWLLALQAVDAADASNLVLAPK